ncbi:MAG: VOC family protein [Alphaproteobacteria bacterium]|nr:VOC family protein [Alphaproteobacteria bacterium]
MSGIEITPRIFFQGNCREAMTFYQSVLGGALTLKTYGEAMGTKAPEGLADKIAEAELSSGTTRLRAWDSKLANAEARKIELEISGEDENQLRKIFDGLCDGGKAKHPLEKQESGAVSGRLFDRFGLDWIVTVRK